MKERDKLGSFVDPSTASYNINDLILNDGIYDPRRISEILLDRGIWSEMRNGYWKNSAENDFDLLMNRVLSHIKSIRDEKKRLNTVRTRMANAGYSPALIDDMTSWVRSVVPDPAHYSKAHK